MRRKVDYPLKKHSLNLRDGDYEKLQDMHPRLGAGRVIREMVMAHVDRVTLELGEDQETQEQAT